jgi:carbamoyl-phosphate synthase large subunit
MSGRLNVLVLGVGGNVSQSILKALRLCSVPCRVIGGCISPLSMGLYTVDKAYLSPLANDAAFFDWLVRICRAEHVDAVLSGAEPVLAAVAPRVRELYASTGSVTIVSPPELLAIANDKLRTCEWLRDHGLNYPRYADAMDRNAVETLVQNCGFPLIAKPRAGKGSHGIAVAQSQRELEPWLERKGYVVEEYLGDESNEFTVGCFSDRDGQVRGAIAMSRELLQGTTYRAVVGDFPELREEAVRIAAALKPVGPCNIQMRVAKGRPVCFEINLRFSGTTALRARFGFNDVEAALRHHVLGEKAVDLPLVTQGIALRYWNEVYIDPKANSVLEASGVLESPAGYKNQVEDYGINP